MFGLISWEFHEIFKTGFLVHQILSSCCYFCFLFPSTALKFLAVAMAMSKCRTIELLTIELPNHPNFALQKKIIFQKITDTNLELNALVHQFLSS